MNALLQYLLTQTNIATAMGSRGFPIYFPEKTVAPAFAVRLVDRDYEQDSAGLTGVAESLVEVAIYAVPYGDLDTLGGMILNALNGFAGNWGGVEVQSCRIEPGEHDTYQPYGDGRAGGVFLRVQEYRVRHVVNISSTGGE